MKTFSIDQVMMYLGSPTKRKIIIHLYTCFCTSCDIIKLCYILAQKQANVSKHLMDLKRVNMVEFQKIKQRIEYQLTPKFKKEYEDLLEFLKNKEEDGCRCNEN